MNNPKNNRQKRDCSELKQMLFDDPEFLSKVLTGDGTWVYGYTLERKSL